MPLSSNFTVLFRDSRSGIAKWNKTEQKRIEQRNVVEDQDDQMSLLDIPDLLFFLSAHSFC